MEIKIRTYEEFRADRVTIEITGTGAEVREMVDREESTEVAKNEEYHLARISELEEKLARAEAKVHAFNLDRHTEQERADRLKVELNRMRGQKTDAINGKDMALGALADARAERDQLKTKVAELESKLMVGHVCTGGCSGDQHVAFLGRKALTEMENQVAALTRRIDHMTEVLSADDVQQAQRMDCSRLGATMAKAIDKALHGLA